MENRIIKLSKSIFAVRFIYHVVTERTLFMSIPNKSELFGKSLKFTSESLEAGGTMRMDNLIFEKSFPNELEVFKKKGLSGKDYVLVQVID